MTPLYLRFPDEAEANSVLYTKVPTAWDEEGNPAEWYDKPNYANIDTIGVMYNDDAIIEDGEVISPATPLEGWHVNVLLLDGEDGDALAPYAITEPSTPLRKWKTEVSA